MRMLGLALSLLVASSALGQGEGDVERTRVPIDMADADLEQFLQLVSTELNVRFLYDEKITKRKVTLLSPQGIPKSELFGVLLSVLEMQNFTTVRTGSPEAEVWKVVPFTAPIANPCNKGQIPVRSLEDVDRLAPGDAVTMLVVRLKHIDARSAFIAIQGMASDPRMVQAIESAGTVVVTDTANNIRRIGEAIRQADQPFVDEGAPSFRVEAFLVEAPTDGLEKTEDATAQLAALQARAGRDGVRVLYHWRGQVQDDCPVSSEQSKGAESEEGVGETVKLEMTTTFAHVAPSGAAEPQAPAASSERSRQPDLDGDVSIRIGYDLTEIRQGTASRRVRECVTLAGDQRAWLSAMAGGGGASARTLLFFARAEVAK